MGYFLRFDADFRDVGLGYFRDAFTKLGRVVGLASLGGSGWSWWGCSPEGLRAWGLGWFCIGFGWAEAARGLIRGVYGWY